MSFESPNINLCTLFGLPFLILITNSNMNNYKSFVQSIIVIGKGNTHLEICSHI